MRNVSIPTMLLLSLFIAETFSAPTDSPLKIRINSDLIKTIIHKRDEELLDLYKDMKLGDFSLDILDESEELKLKQLTVSFVPRTGEQQHYDHHISLNQNDFIGIECNDLKFVGKGVLYHGDSRVDGENFEYEGLIDKMRLVFDFKDAETTEYGQPGKELNIKSLDFEVNTQSIVIKATGKNQGLFE